MKVIKFLGKFYIEGREIKPAKWKKKTYISYDFK